MSIFEDTDFADQMADVANAEDDADQAEFDQRVLEAERLIFAVTDPEARVALENLLAFINERLRP